MQSLIIHGPRAFRRAKVGCRETDLCAIYRLNDTNYHIACMHAINVAQSWWSIDIGLFCAMSTHTYSPRSAYNGESICGKQQ